METTRCQKCKKLFPKTLHVIIQHVKSFIFKKVCPSCAAILTTNNNTTTKGDWKYT